MRHEVYVAFSIHGSHAFITANIETELPAKPRTGEAVTVGDFKFSVGESRTSSERGATKLLWSELTARNNRPLSDPDAVLQAFNRLRAAGWIVDDMAFRRRHEAALKKAQDKREADAARELERALTAEMEAAKNPTEERKAAQAEGVPMEGGGFYSRTPVSDAVEFADPANAKPEEAKPLSDYAAPDNPSATDPAPDANDKPTEPHERLGDNLNK